MPYINRRTGQILNIPQQSGGFNPSFFAGQGMQQMPQRQISQQSASAGNINPLSFIRSGLNIGSKFSGEGIGTALQGLGNTLGLGSAIAQGSPAGIASNALGLGLTGAKAGLFGSGAQAAVTPAAGSMLGALGPVSAGLGAANFFANLGGRAQNPHFLGIFGPTTSGQTLKDIKAEGKIVAGNKAIVQKAIQTGTPVSLSSLNTTGSFTRDATGSFTTTAGHAPKLLAEYLNRGIELPREHNVEKAEPNYIIPIRASFGEFSAGQQSLHPNPNAQMFPILLSVPADEVTRHVSDVTGQVTYTATSEDRDIRQSASDARSERRGRGKDD